ncbi:MAG TPA: hypothetical protein PKO06_15235 [Candidatus Ozemobacteraceae bacterium]|nr:hypothetical protein [Candidatus Ozemobacteraceae bacterium]
MWGETWLKHAGCWPKYQVRLARRDGFRFVYVYLWRLGFLDGRKGFQYACLQAFYEFLINLKLDEQR